MDLCERNDIQALLARHGFRFSRALGQNFLSEGSGLASVPQTAQ